MRTVCLFIKNALVGSPTPLSTCCPRWTSLLIVYLTFRGLITAIKRARWPSSPECASMNKRLFRAIKGVQNYFGRDRLNRLFHRPFIDMVQNLTTLFWMWNILKFVHNLQLKMYEKSPSKRLKITILKNVPRAPALLRQAFMFAFNLKSFFFFGHHALKG